MQNNKYTNIIYGILLFCIISLMVLLNCSYFLNKSGYITFGLHDKSKISVMNWFSTLLIFQQVITSVSTRHLDTIFYTTHSFKQLDSLSNYIITIKEGNLAINKDSLFTNGRIDSTLISVVYRPNYEIQSDSMVNDSVIDKNDLDGIVINDRKLLKESENNIDSGIVMNSEIFLKDSSHLLQSNKLNNLLINASTYGLYIDSSNMIEDSNMLYCNIIFDYNVTVTYINDSLNQLEYIKSGCFKSYFHKDEKKVIMDSTILISCIE